MKHTQQQGGMIVDRFTDLTHDSNIEYKSQLEIHNPEVLNHAASKMDKPHKMQNSTSP